MEKYVPNPVDTSSIPLPDSLEDLVEQLAENTHEVWAKGRMKEGWSYGDERNDAKKKHPCLVPYDALTEGEKEYDRNTAVETIKLLLALGYGIVEPE